MAIGLTDDEAFNYAVNVVLKHEGGFTNNPSDPGGATNFGISLRFLKQIGIDLNHDGIIDIDDIKSITTASATAIYKEQWWNKYHYGLIDALDIATKIFDMSVNMGSMQAHKIVQEACNYLGYKLVKDGILGMKTIETINELCLHGRRDDLMDEICDCQKWFYEYLIEHNPSLYIFKNGWMARASSQGS